MTIPRTRAMAAGKTKLPKWLINSLFKVFVTLVPGLVLYYELQGRNDLPDIAAALCQQLQQADSSWLCFACLLIPLNWMAEVQKWRPFILRSESITRWHALKAVLAGTSFALFTPNRIGEYGGRLLFIRPENHWKAFIANAVGSIGQYLVILTGGIAGGIWFAAYSFGWQAEALVQALAAGLLLLAGLHYFYFNIRLIIPLGRRLPLPKKILSWRRNIDILEHFSRSDLAEILGWSALRYAIYSTQYLLLLQFFGIKTGVIAGFSGIATIFLLQTIIPLPAIAGLLVRGNLALFIWSGFGASEVNILAATFVLWIINLILPALVGTFSLFHVNITKTFGYDDE